MCVREYDNEIGSTHHHECRLAEEAEEKLYHTKNFFVDMLDLMYGKKEFDRNDLENYIGEICFYLNIKEPIEPLQIISNGLREVKNV